MNKLYSNDKTQAIDQLAAAYLGVDSFELMQLAASAVYQHLKDYSSLLVITGPGNNGGDGFVIAELARQQGQSVKVLAMRESAALQGDAQLAAEQYQGEVISSSALQQQKYDFDVIVDAMFGTGLTQSLQQPYVGVIEWMNQQQAPILAVDIPSGLNGTTGQIAGIAVKADQTISILVRNTGLYTLDGKDYSGEIQCEPLAVPQHVFEKIDATGELLAAETLHEVLGVRSNNSHKGQFGHVLTAGGQTGMLGAVLLAARAVLKSGAGSTTVLTDSRQAYLVPLQVPEIMSVGFNDEADLLDALALKPADVLLLGMGMGQAKWSKKLFKSAVKRQLPLVLDADGLNLLAVAATVPAQLAVMTPHPKEAAFLLNTTVSAVQENRWLAVKTLANKYECVVVLKGSGTLISNGETVSCCPYGNANLATAGSGDVLAGLVAGLMAQGFAALKAAQLAVIWHALAGESSDYGMSLTASDLLNSMHLVWYLIDEGNI